MYLTANGGHIVGNVTGNDAAASVRGTISPDCRDAVLLVNARVHCRPDELRAVVEARLPSVAGGCGIEPTITQVRSFFPGRPQPTHRYQAVVPAGPPETP